MIVGPEHRDRRARLGQPVGVDETDVGQQPECLAHQRKCDLRAAVGEGPQCGQPGRLRLQGRHDAIQHRRHDGSRRDAFVTDQPEPLGGVELRQVHHLSAGIQIRQRRAHARDVIRRHTDQRGIAGFGRVELDRSGDVAGQVVMGQLNGFGSRRRARGEQHDAYVLGVRELGSRLGRARGRDELPGLDELLACSGDDVSVFRVGHNQRLRQAVDQFAQAVTAQAVVEGRERHARAGRGEQQQRQHGPAHADVSDVGGTRGCDDTCTAIGERAQFVCRQSHLAGHQRGPVRICRGCHLKQQRDAHGLSTKISRMGSSPPP